MSHNVLDVDMRKMVLLLAAGLLTVGAATAQEFNLGVHFNPIFTHPVVSSKSVYDKEVRPVYFTPGYNVGLNLNYKAGANLSVETGLNIVQKFMRFNDRRGNVFGSDADYYVSLGTTSFEVPLLVNYRIYHHDNRTNYDLYALAGAAYETGDAGGKATGTTSYGNNGTLLQVEGSYNGNATTSYVTGIIGFKINAVLRGVGLIDYGLSYHLPMQAAGPYNVSVALGRNGSANSYKGTLYAHMSYIDFKLCYYFLNLNKRFGRVWYRMKG